MPSIKRQKMVSLPPFEQGKQLSALSTFGIGGPASYFTVAHTEEEMAALLSHCFKTALPYIVIGKGSNCLFDDRGFDGLVILNKIAFCTYEENRVHVGAGYSFSLLGAQTARKGWAGLEFASGIPGSVGGAVYMNAGANGSETKDALLNVTYVSEKGESLCLPKEEMQFAYRFSSFQQQKGAIVSARFQLTPCQEAREKQLKIIDYRTQTQPYGDKSAGCLFRNPPSASAGALIDKCGLKGLSVGGAEVSLLHGNFIVNKKNATAQDVLELVHLVKKKVKEITGIELEMEVRPIPYRLLDDVPR